MCLTHASLYLFLSLLDPTIIEPAKTQITIHATEGDVIWFARGETWCKAGPGYRADQTEPPPQAATTS